MTTKGAANARLAEEPSPYLRSAAHQPVQWHPWGPDAFDQARREDKPILLDVGAVWCHWCHVMDGESYDDPEVARIINERFVPVKVDRDERPDVDARYQKLVGALTGQGGWPLTAFLTPEGDVYYGGTYFPPRDALGRPSFRRVLEAVSDAYRTGRERVREQAEAIHEAVKAQTANDGAQPVELTLAWLEERVDALGHHFDHGHGGWGQAPKFPHPAAVEVLLHAIDRGAGDAPRSMVEATLKGMGEGGVYDHVGGGFHRYSVDAEWHVPHFEKMLYDNADLLRNYVLAWKVLRDPYHRSKAMDIVRFLRETLSDRGRGGFYGSQDADARSEDDGDYFTWTRGEVLEAVNGNEELARTLWFRYGIEEQGSMHHNRAKNVLRTVAPVEAIGDTRHQSMETVTKDLDRGMACLREARTQRPAPFVDPVLYTNWNAMAIRATFEFAAAFNAEPERAFALRTLDRFLSEAFDPARGFAHALGGKPLWGFLDDNAQMLVALLEAFHCTQMPRYLDAARDTARVLEREFWDASRAAFVDTAPSARPANSPRPLAEPEVPLQDGPGTSPNARAAEGLLLLAAHTDEVAWAHMATKLMERHAATAARLGLFGAGLLLVAHHLVHARIKIVVAGPIADPAVAQLHRLALAEARPGDSVVVIHHGEPSALLPPEAAAFVAGPARNQAAALVCVGTRCLAPATTTGALAQALREARA